MPAALFPTCLPENMTVIDGYVHCTAWEMREMLYPMYELSPEETGAIMAAIAAFLAVCFAGRALVRVLLSAGTSTSND